jgi:membrane-bound lytic murein transglycosylase B
MSKHSRWISIGEWRAMGVTNTSGKPWPADDVLATLVEPDGPGTAAYLTYGNYRAIMAYNCSNFYALSVALLGDALD